MHITVVPASEADRPVLSNLFQLYVYDFTDFKQWDVEDDGRFKEVGLAEWWASNDRRLFLIKVEGRLAGFAVVGVEGDERGEGRILTIEEFFVLRRYRRLGVGEHAARWLFDRFRGTWEVREIAGNDAAVRFWRNVITRYTKDQFHEIEQHDDQWRGTVQSFDNSL